MFLSKDCQKEVNIENVSANHVPFLLFQAAFFICFDEEPQDFIMVRIQDLTYVDLHYDLPITYLES